MDPNLVLQRMEQEQAKTANRREAPPPPFSPVQAALDHLAARYEAVQNGTGHRPDATEIAAWERLGEHVDKLKKAYSDYAKRGLEPPPVR